MTVFTNGCFDILHRGHLELLKYCSDVTCPAMGGSLIVGLNSDESVRRLKGEGRPINNEKDRKFFLESLKFVDKVVVFEEDTPLKLIEEIKPNIIVKGGDYKAEDVVGGDICKVRIFNYVEGYSTTDTINEIFSNRR
jgi:D-beta-D-heptose 7-phosphate kinase/D-beta-D-heptose 1-phosphate adenosyltransferase